MKVTVEEISPSKRALLVELPSDRVAARREETVRELSRRLQVPGFRKGKVPREVIERRFHAEVDEEVLRELIPASYQEAVEQSALAPVGQPSVEEVHLHAGEPLRYKAVVDVKPAIALADYKGIGLERDKIEVTGPEIDKAVEYLREDAAEYAPMEGWPALRDDLLIVDYEGSVQGKPFKGGSGKGVTLAVGRGSVLPGFDEQLLGLQKGEQKQFSLLVPDDFPRKELAGRPVEFRVLVREVKKRRVPELNDEFAKTVGDVETLAALREQLTERIRTRKSQEQDAGLKRALLEKLAAQHEIELPEAMVERETGAVLDELLMSLRMGGGRMEGLPDSPEAIRARAREVASRRVKESLLLEAVAKQEGLTVGEEEITAETSAMAAAYRQSPEAIQRFLEEPGRREGLTGRLLERKALDFLFQHASITDAYRLITPA
jgi:trigger factor